MSLYDPAEKRLNSIYLGAAPEYGKRAFKKHLEKEIIKIKACYPEALYWASPMAPNITGTS